MSSIFDAATLKSISPHALAGYLRSHQWNDVSAWGDFARLYRKTIGARDVEIVLPTKTGLADYARRVSELIAEVSEAEDTPAPAIINDLTLALYDVIRVKAKAADQFGSISLEVAQELFGSGRDLLIVAAAHEASGRPDPDRRGRMPDIAREYIDRVRLGQTEKGSFVLTLLSPFSFVPIEDPDDGAGGPFGRRVVERLGMAMEAVEKALQDSVAKGTQVFEDGVEAGVSAKLCRSLGQIAERAGGAEISVGWSVQKPNDKLCQLALGRETAPVLFAAATLLASKAAPETERISGTINTVMERESDLEGRVKIGVQIGTNRFRTIQTSFNKADREAVFEAFQKKKFFYISLTGELNRKTRPWTLENPRDFQVVEFDAGE